MVNVLKITELWPDQYGNSICKMKFFSCTDKLQNDHNLILMFSLGRSFNKECVEENKLIFSREFFGLLPSACGDKPFWETTTVFDGEIFWICFPSSSDSYRWLPPFRLSCTPGKPPDFYIFNCHINNIYYILCLIYSVSLSPFI